MQKIKKRKIINGVFGEDIEKKWQKFWIDNKSFEPSDDFSKPKYILR